MVMYKAFSRVPAWCPSDSSAYNSIGNSNGTLHVCVLYAVVMCMYYHSYSAQWPPLRGVVIELLKRQKNLQLCTFSEFNHISILVVVLVNISCMLLCNGIAIILWIIHIALHGCFKCACMVAYLKLSYYTNSVMNKDHSSVYKSCG